MADTKKKGKLVNRAGAGLIVLFAFAALVPTWIAWTAFWGATIIVIACVVIYQRRSGTSWNDLLMDGNGSHKRTARAITLWFLLLCFLVLAAYVRLHLKDAEGALVALA